jgi:hypothetical protein
MRKIAEIKQLPYEAKYKIVESYLNTVSHSNTFWKYANDLFLCVQFPPVALIDYFLEIIDMAIGAGQQYKRSIHQSTFKDLDDIYS